MTVSNQQSGMTKRSVSNFFATLFSELLDEQVSPRQARAIINAIIAFFAIIISSAAPICRITIMAVAAAVGAICGRTACPCC